jgi:hypothetical protein
MPMAIEAESVKPGFGSFAQIRPRAAVTLDTQGGSRSVGIVVVAGEAVDRAARTPGSGAAGLAVSFAADAVRATA